MPEANTERREQDGDDDLAADLTTTWHFLSAIFAKADDSNLTVVVDCWAPNEEANKDGGPHKFVVGYLGIQGKLYHRQKKKKKIVDTNFLSVMSVLPLIIRMLSSALEVVFGFLLKFQVFNS
jgi:hypothetical protein